MKDSIVNELITAMKDRYFMYRERGGVPQASGRGRFYD